jgi:hypothetical protein
LSFIRLLFRLSARSGLPAPNLSAIRDRLASSVGAIEARWNAFGPWLHRSKVSFLIHDVNASAAREQEVET